MNLSAFRLDVRISLMYALFGGLWIYFSDRLVFQLIPNPSALIQIQTYKGWLFVALSTLIIFLLLRRELYQRRMTERKLSETDERYQQLFEHSLDAILLSAPDGRIFAANPTACEMFGRSEEEITQVGRNGLVDATDVRFQEALEERARTGKFRRELTLVHKNGTKFEAEISNRVYKNSAGLERTSMIIRDITERKQTEEKMRESEVRFSIIFHASPIGINLFRVSDGRSVNANDAFLELIGYEREELIGHSAVELDLFVDTEARRVWMEELRMTGKIRGVDAQIRRKSGEIREALASIDIIELGGERMGLVIAADISDRKRAEHALKKNEQILRLFVEHTPASVAMFDRDMRYIVASNRYAADYELGHQNLVGLSHYEVFPEIPRRWKEIHRHCLAGAIERSEEDPFPRKDGRLDWVRWEIRPWYEREGEIGGIILFSEVITERKLAQEEIRQRRDQLMELSRRLAETRESEARAIGRELHDQIGQMLTALKITLDMAIQLPAENTAKKLQQAQSITTDLLERVSQLSLQLRPPMLDDLGLIPALVWHVNRWQEQSGIRVEFKHHSMEGKRFATEIETAAYRIVQEALTNVARHAQATQVRIEIQNSGEELEIEIADNGIGFDSQAALAKNRGLGGMRERAQLIGGTFHIESEQGNTRKIIRLPLKERI